MVDKKVLEEVRKELMSLSKEEFWERWEEIEKNPPPFLQLYRKAKEECE